MVACLAAPSPSWGEGEPVVISVRRDHALESMFRNRRGWLGGDSADSVPLGGGRVLWLFGDSYHGREEEGGRRKIEGMIRNAVALREGGGRLRFLPSMPKERSGAFFPPDDGSEWVWPCRGGMRTRAGLYVFLPKFQTMSGRPEGFGFTMTGMLLAKISNPDDPPECWKIRCFRVPDPVRGRPGGRMSFGNPFRGNDGRIYLPGMEDDVVGGRRLLMARTASECLEDFGSWEYRTDTGWNRRPRAAARLCDHVGAELSVSWKPFLGSYLLVTTENGLSNRIVARTAPQPWGPWSADVTLYRAPESLRDSTLACYAGKEHPELAGEGGEITISYVCNADPRKVENDPTLYRPRFVRVRLKVPPRS